MHTSGYTQGGIYVHMYSTSPFEVVCIVTSTNSHCDILPALDCTAESCADIHCRVTLDDLSATS
jgi:hypothetical protein